MLGNVLMQVRILVGLIGCGAAPEELLKQLHNMWKPIPWLER
jgi:hypothetical protein